MKEPLRKDVYDVEDFVVYVSYTRSDGVMYVVDHVVSKHGYILLEVLLNDGNYDVVYNDDVRSATDAEIASRKRMPDVEYYKILDDYDIATRNAK